MAGWLAITDDQNLEKIKSNALFGVSDRNKNHFSQLKKNDLLFIYVKPKRLAGYVQVVKKLDHPKISWDKYTNQIEISTIHLLNEPKDLNAKFIDTLTLFHGKFWGPTLFGRALIALSDTDVDKLKSFLQEL